MAKWSFFNYNNYNALILYIYRFKDGPSLQEHLQIHHTKGGLQCSDCDEVLPNDPLLKSHMRRLHGEETITQAQSSDTDQNIQNQSDCDSRDDQSTGAPSSENLLHNDAQIEEDQSANSNKDQSKVEMKIDRDTTTN